MVLLTVTQTPRYEQFILRTLQDSVLGVCCSYCRPRHSGELGSQGSEGRISPMVFYTEIDSSTQGGKRTADRLSTLKDALEEQIPKRNVAGKLLLATWNIREFDSEKYGKRTDESLYYIAEIIDHFDLVAVQEVRDDLTALRRLRHLLGWWWQYL